MRWQKEPVCVCNQLLNISQAIHHNKGQQAVVGCLISERIWQISCFIPNAMIRFAPSSASGLWQAPRTQRSGGASLFWACRASLPPKKQKFLYTHPKLWQLHERSIPALAINMGLVLQLWFCLLQLSIVAIECKNRGFWQHPINQDTFDHGTFSIRVLS